jgi:GTP-binding protein
MPKPLIALVGRPNVGKSTLFNRLSTKKKAIVHDMPGVTRDRKYAEGAIGPIEFTIIDTPGLEDAKEGQIEYGMTEQTISAIKSSDIVCLVVDAITGITPQDIFFANLIRKIAKKYILIANKCEKEINIDHLYYKIGFGEPIQLSAAHGLGMMSLCEKLLELIDDDSENYNHDRDKDDNLRIAIVGRPNAGKSTFINSLLRENRVLTSPDAGTTRDSVDVIWEYKGRAVTLVDTAGLRKKNNITDNLEKLSASDTIHSIKFANTVILMLDGTKPLEHQDLVIANFIINEGRSLVLAFNKWDLVEQKRVYKEAIEHKLSSDLSQVEGVSCIYLSALKNNGTTDVMDACFDMYALWNKKIPTSKLNEWLEMATERHPLPLQKNGRRLRIKYCTQVGIRPPTFRFFSNKADSIVDSYKRYLINDLRHSFGIPGVPIRFQFISQNNPYDSKK